MVVIIKLLASNEIMLSTCPHLPFDSYFGEPSGRKEAGRQAGRHAQGSQRRVQWARAGMPDGAACPGRLGVFRGHTAVTFVPSTLAFLDDLPLQLTHCFSVNISDAPGN